MSNETQCEEVKVEVCQDDRQDEPRPGVAEREDEEKRNIAQGGEDALVEMVGDLQSDAGSDCHPGAAGQKPHLGHDKSARDRLLFERVDQRIDQKEGQAPAPIRPVKKPHIGVMERKRGPHGDLVTEAKRIRGWPSK